MAKYLYGIKEHPRHTDLAGKDLSSYLREMINFVGFIFRDARMPKCLVMEKNRCKDSVARRLPLAFLLLLLFDSTTSVLGEYCN